MSLLVKIAMGSVILEKTWDDETAPGPACRAIDPQGGNPQVESARWECTLLRTGRVLRLPRDDARARARGNPGYSIRMQG